MDGSVVVVTGATGRQGGAAARHLLAAGWRVRALTRRPDGAPARALASQGADVIGADMGDLESLVSPLRGAHGVFSVQNSMTSGLAAEVDQGTNVAQAADRAGVQHVVYASAGTGAPDTGIGSWDAKLAVEQRMRELDLPVTVLRPMAFMELMTDKAFYPPVSTWHVMPRLVGEDRPVLWIGVDDVGAIAARVFADRDRFVGADLSLVSDVKSLRQCRRIWQEVTGRAPRGFPMPVRVFERFVGKDLPTMWRWLRTAELEADTAPTRQILPSALTVEEWVARRAAPARGGR